MIDIEVLLGEEPGVGGGRWREKLTAASPGPPCPADPGGRRLIFKAWLEARREEHVGTLPGQGIAAGWRMLGVLSAVLGVFVGGSVTAGLLHYRGAEPVNVTWFLAVTVGVQLGLLAVAAAFAGVRATTSLFQGVHPVRRLISGLVWLCSAGSRRLPGEQREALRAGLGVLERKRELYGSLAVWPFLVVTQLFAVAFNLGILAMLFAHVTATDLAFGWQSTLRLSPEAVHRVVVVISLPWGWLGPEAHPSLEQIVGSRFSYSDGMGPLDRAALASWWPFLAGTVAVYGLLARAALLGLAGFALRRGLRGVAFDHEGCNTLLRRLTGPLVRAQGGTAALEIPDLPVAPEADARRGGECIALVATDLDLPPGPLGAYVGRAFGWMLARSLPARIDHPSGNGEALAALAATGGERRRVVVVARARRSPIRAMALFLERVTEAAGSGAEVVLLLVGRGDGPDFAAVEDADWQHWRNFQAIHRLRLGLEKWSGP